jgi:iron complex outermembrane receptor protein
MKKYCFKASSWAGAGILVLVFSLPVCAADSSASSSPPIAEGARTELEEVIVTARRKEESLQDVPESLDAVTSEELQKYNILEIADLSKVVPGFSASYSDPVATFTLRGLSSTSSNIPPTMQMYINDGPTNPVLLFQSLYDVGQVEVLRGPQGTIRGKIAETGALTLTTHLPDLEEVGGYSQVSRGNLEDTNIQGAIGLPLVKDIFAIRLAATFDENEGNGVGSVMSTTPPRNQFEAGRITARLVPSDSIDVLVSYQHGYRNDTFYYGGGPYFGPGNGIDGPPLSVGQMTTVAPGPNIIDTHYDDAEGTINFRFAGQKITYVGSYNRDSEDSEILQFNSANIDNVNAGAPTVALTTEWSQDIRISSDSPLFGGWFDYVAGFFYDSYDESVLSDAGTSYLPGAFGTPLGAPVAGPPNLLFTTKEIYGVNDTQTEQAWYTNETVHFDRQTELSAGLRYSREAHNAETNVTIPPGVAGVALPAPFCAFAGGQYGVTYPGVCNVPTPALSIPIAPDIAVYHPLIYNVELSHRFNDDLMMYVRTGNSWRNGALNPVLAAHTNGNPQFDPYLLPAPEKMKDYEFGIKGDLFDKRLTFDVDYFHMSYSSFFYTAQAAWYVDYTAGVPAATHASIGTFDLPAKIDGLEFNAAARLTNQWTASAALAFADGRVNGSGPCDPPGLGPNASPAAALAALQAAGVVTFICPGLHDSTAHIPRWNFNVQSEYDQPISSTMQGFVRGLLNYYPSNPYTSLVGYTAPSYTTLDLYIGVNHPNRSWEVALYGKNITNDRTITDIPFSQVSSAEVPTLSAFFPRNSGYAQATLVPQREFGITLRHSFGSR